MWKRIIRRMLQYTGIFLLVFFLLAGFWFFIGGALCNDLRAAKLERTFKAMKLPEGVTLIETSSFVGNTTGTGNHTEIWAGMLLYAELPEDGKSSEDRKLSETEEEAKENADPEQGVSEDDGTSLEIKRFQESLMDYFEEYEVYAVPEDLNRNYPYQKDFMEFQALQGKDSGRGYFVVSNYYDAVTQVDLRGH